MEFGFDLYDVVKWPWSKKMVYAEHIKAYNAAQEAAANGDMPDVSDIGGQDAPSASELREAAQTASSAASSTPAASSRGGPANKHPVLNQYRTGGGGVINVQNPGEQMSDERKAEIMNKPEMTYDGEPTIDGDGIESHRRRITKIDDEADVEDLYDE